jgi:hypothetical protein
MIDRQTDTDVLIWINRKMYDRLSFLVTSQGGVANILLLLTSIPLTGDSWIISRLQNKYRFNLTVSDIYCTWFY